MRACAEYEELIDREHTGEPVADADRERLAEHLESCRSCDELFDLVGELGRSPSLDEPTDEELAAMRQRVRTSLDRPAVLSFRPRVRRWLPVALASAAALGGVALGWTLAAGRGAAGERQPLAGGWSATPVAEASLETELRGVASRHASFAAASESPYTFTNVRLSEVAGGRLRLSFDVSRHLEFQLDREDPLLAEVLVQAVLETESVGGRLAAIEAVPTRLEPKVERALVVAMLRDANLGVRMRAQERLAVLRGDDEVEAAMLEVLASEASVEMRFVAIDYLAQSGMDPERVEAAIRDGESLGERAVLLRARNLMKTNDLIGKEF